MYEYYYAYPTMYARCGGMAAFSQEHDNATKILHAELRARGAEVFYKQPPTELTHGQAADVLASGQLTADKSVREAGDTSRLANKFEKKLDNVVLNKFPPHLNDAMSDVIIESARDLSEYFVSKNFKNLVKSGLIAEMQNRGNEILIDSNGDTESFFFAAQRLKDKELEAKEPRNRTAFYLAKKLDECAKCRTMPRKLMGSMKEHVKNAAEYLSDKVTTPDAEIEAFVLLLEEMDAAGDTPLIEGNIPKSHKDAAAYLKQLTTKVDEINRPNPALQSQVEGKLKTLMGNAPLAGYTANDMKKVISEQTKLLVSYVTLQEDKTKQLKILIEKMEAQGDKMILRHGHIQKSFLDAADLLHDKNTDQLSEAQNGDPVAVRKIQLKLANLVAGRVPDADKETMIAVVQDATNYLAVHLLQPQIIKVCKCMKSVFVQCELWCEEILRRVARPCCTCSRHVSSQVLSELAPTRRIRVSPGHSHAFCPGLDIAVTQCPSTAPERNASSRPCPATAAGKCPGIRPPNPDTYFMYTSTRFNPMHRPCPTCPITPMTQPPINLQSTTRHSNTADCSSPPRLLTPNVSPTRRSSPNSSLNPAFSSSMASHFFSAHGFSSQLNSPSRSTNLIPADPINRSSPSVSPSRIRRPQSPGRLSPIRSLSPSGRLSTKRPSSPSNHLSPLRSSSPSFNIRPSSPSMRVSPLRPSSPVVRLSPVRSSSPKFHIHSVTPGGASPRHISTPTYEPPMHPLNQSSSKSPSRSPATPPSPKSLSPRGFSSPTRHTQPAVRSSPTRRSSSTYRMSPSRPRDALSRLSPTRRSSRTLWCSPSRPSETPTRLTSRRAVPGSRLYATRNNNLTKKPAPSMTRSQFSPRRISDHTSSTLHRSLEATTSKMATSSTSDSYNTPTFTPTPRTETKVPPFFQTPTTMTMYETTRDATMDAPREPLPEDFEMSDRNRSPVVTTDQMSDMHAMVVSLMWNVQAWRDWLQENLDRALADHHATDRTEDEALSEWYEFQRRVTTEALQWRQYNIFSRQLTLRLALRYRDKEIVSPTRATVKTRVYIQCQREMLEIIDMFSKWTHWLMVVLKETELLQRDVSSSVPLHERCWEHFKKKVEANLHDWIKYNTLLKSFWEYKYRSIISEWVPSGEPSAPVWVVSACGAVPSGAVAAGVYDGELVWLARTTHKSEVLPAALVPSKHCCLIYAEGAVHHYTKYQVMCNAEVSWVTRRADAAMDPRAVCVAPGVHVGRVLYRASHLVGAVLPPRHRCHVVIYGRSFAFNCYELLVSAPPEEP